MVDNFIHSQSETPKIKPGVRIIKSSDYQQYQTAKELWEKTQLDIAAHHVEAENLKMQSIEKGLSAGAEEAKSRLASQILQSATSFVNQLSAIEKDLSQVVNNAVRKIITDFDDNDLVFAAVKKGLKPVYQSQRVAIRVHPTMVENINERLQEIGHSIEFLDVSADARLNETDCIIESDAGIVDASIETQLEAISKAIASQFSGSTALP
ncbi:MAG: HrpE/YscL family type III secretion apparatus protein [Thiotrichaceae bacterium]|nr:HrpE/YscL family type III secretion apparatus protein [Thiotrichaceae bacterium]